MKSFFEKAAKQDHPLRLLEQFLEQEKANEQAKKYDEMRFVGYVLEIGYESVTIITADRFKINVGGVPRNSLLIMTPSKPENLPLHFTILRVLESAPTPLSKEVQQTYFELQKKSMPELDIFTQSELQWGALKTGVLGMFYEHREKENKIEFSGDLNNFLSAHKYRVYSPTRDLLHLIVNSLVPEENQFQIGELRLTECRLGQKNDQPKVSVFVSTKDFMGARTAMFGKTRLGKSNVVKLIAQSLIETTAETKTVGQLIFDIDGEYANDNPWDDARSLKSAYADRCIVYALNPKSQTDSKPLKLNFYEQPDKCLLILASLIRQDDPNPSTYIRVFISLELPDIEVVRKIPNNKDTIGDKNRAIRKLQMYWAILKKAAYPVDEIKLMRLVPNGGQNGPQGFNPSFSSALQQAAYEFLNADSNQLVQVPLPPTTLDELKRELEIINRFRRANRTDKVLVSSSGNSVFDADDEALLEFLEPQPGRSGATLLQPYRIYHDPNAGNFIEEILRHLDAGDTAILDLSNANPAVRRYFSNELSQAVFNHQERKFTNNNLENHYVQLYFEEAHNLFPNDKKDVTDIYSRFAKEGAKYHIGMVYSTQSPTTVNKDLLGQTENFFILHLSSEEEVNALAKLQVAYKGIQGDILLSKTPGYVRMLTRSHRFIVPVQANRFTLSAIGNDSSLNGSR